MGKVWHWRRNRAKVRRSWGHQWVGTKHWSIPKSSIRVYFSNVSKWTIWGIWSCHQPLRVVRNKSPPICPPLHQEISFIWFSSWNWRRNLWNPRKFINLKAITNFRVRTPFGFGKHEYLKEWWLWINAFMKLLLVCLVVPFCHSLPKNFCKNCAHQILSGLPRYLKDLKTKNLKTLLFQNLIFGYIKTKHQYTDKNNFKTILKNCVKYNLSYIIWCEITIELKPSITTGLTPALTWFKINAVQL